MFWRKKLKIPDHFINNQTRIKLFDKYHFVPGPPEEYLTYQYGEWKKPMRTSNKRKYLTNEFSGINIIKDYIESIENHIKLHIKNLIKYMINIKY